MLVALPISDQYFSLHALMEALSAQSFIRALKAPTDPPEPGGPSKIALAQSAWTTSSFNIPNKNEAIVDFLLTRLLKDKSRERWACQTLPTKHQPHCHS